MSRLVSIPLDAYPSDALAALSPGPFSIGAARAAMWLAQLGYEEDAAKIAAVMARWGLEPLLIFDRPGASLLPAAHARGYVARGRGVTIAAFGGTDPLVIAHWITDFRFARNAAGEHRGFAEALDIIWGEVADALRAEAGAPVLFTGHSLGAALALLSAEQALTQLNIAPAAVYGFGMPRTGDAAFAARINSAFGRRLYRLAHGQDIVPALPPAALGFCHAGRFLRCGRHRQFDAALLSELPSEEPGNGEGLFQNVRDGLQRILSPARPDGAPGPQDITRLLPAPVADHLPNRYWNALARP